MTAWIPAAVVAAVVLTLCTLAVIRAHRNSVNPPR